MDVADEGVLGVVISYDETDVEDSELGPSGGRETSAAGDRPGFVVVASKFRFESEDDEAQRRFSCWIGTTCGGGLVEDPDDERGRSRTETPSGRRAARREIWPDAIEPRRPRRAGRAKKLSAGRAGRAVVGVVLERQVMVFGRWWWDEGVVSDGVSGKG